MKVWSSQARLACINGVAKMQTMTEMQILKLILCFQQFSAKPLQLVNTAKRLNPDQTAPRGAV